jgi:hypothetical protein
MYDDDDDDVEVEEEVPDMLEETSFISCSAPRDVAAAIYAWQANIQMADDASVVDTLSISESEDGFYASDDDIPIQSQNVFGMVANLLERGALDDSYEESSDIAHSYLASEEEDDVIEEEIQENTSPYETILDDTFNRKTTSSYMAGLKTASMRRHSSTEQHLAQHGGVTWMADQHRDVTIQEERMCC